MIQAYSVEQIRAVEAVALARDGDGTLMRRASYAIALVVAEHTPSPHPGRQVVLLVGSGNNGGDALYAGAFLRASGMRVTAVLTAPDKAHQGGLKALHRARGRLLMHDDPAVAAVIDNADVIIDGLVGLAAKPPLRENAADLVGKANASNALRVAVDLPSGIEPDTGRVRGVAFLADLTVTFGGIKTGLLIADEQVGTIVSVPIGMEMTDQPADLIAMTDGSLQQLLPGPGPGLPTSSPAVWSASSPARRAIRGRPCCPSAAPSGPGRDWSGTPGRRPPRCWRTGRRWWPSPAPADAGKVQAWVVGPGLGTDGPSIALLRWVLNQDVPVLVDADGLTILAALPSLLSVRRRTGQRHPAHPARPGVRPGVPGHRPRRPIGGGPPGGARRAARRCC